MEKKSALKRISGLIIVTAILILPHINLLGNNLPLWGEMRPGPYDIGFGTIERHDYSRVYEAKTDYFGSPTEGERARTIQICFWYPAVKDENAVSMVFGEYSLPYPENADFYEFLNNVHNMYVARLFGVLNRNPRLVADFMDLTMAAVRDIPAADGQFPLIIYHPSAGFGYFDNVAMCEFLASHGFIVAATHPIGFHQLNSENNQAALESAVRDAEFVFSQMRDHPNVDRNKTGCLGFGMGGAAALLFQMRNSDIDAAAGLASPYTTGRTIELIEGNSYYNLGMSQVPVMHMYFEDQEPPDMKLWDSLIYSPRYSYRLNGTNAVNFSIAESATSMIPDSGNFLNTSQCPIYNMVCNHVYHFFNAFLNDDEASLKFINAQPADNGYDPESISYSFLPGDAVPPTTEQFMYIINQYGATEGVKLYEKFNELYPGRLTFQEATFNAMGYQLLGAGQIEDALAIFRLNTEVYPNSANVWDSYADGLIAGGETDRAAECYRRVLEVLPNDTVTTDNLREILRANAENFLNPQTEEN